MQLSSTNGSISLWQMQTASTLKGYTIKEYINQGGFGDVYSAHQHTWSTLDYSWRALQERIDYYYGSEWRHIYAGQKQYHRHLSWSKILAETGTVNT